MRFQPGAVEFGEVAFEIVGNLKTFDLPCAVFQRQNREMGMAADSIKRKPKGTGIQVCFFGIFSLLLLVAVPAEQDCGIEIFSDGTAKAPDADRNSHGVLRARRDRDEVPGREIRGRYPV